MRINSSNGVAVTPRSKRMAAVGVSILGALFACAVFAPWLAPYDPTERVTTPFAEPSGSHWLGSDDV